MLSTLSIVSRSISMPPKKNSATSTLASTFRLPFEINKDRIAELFKTIHNKPGFIVDFDDVWPVLNWSRKDNAVAKLTNETSGMTGLYVKGNREIECSITYSCDDRNKITYSCDDRNKLSNILYL
jgi:hypothetical protein